MNELKKLCDKISKTAVCKFVVAPKGWYTIKQLSKEMKISEPSALRKITIMLEKGEVEKKKFSIETSRGSYPVPHYRYVSTK
jgi:predicted transcriptional regulator